jgi:hypothetical protein
MWLFVPGHTFPLQLSNLCNTIHINWMYDNYTNTLKTPINDIQVQCKFSWLSAKIHVQDPFTPGEVLEYEMDDFIEKFSVYTKSTIPPSLYIIFMCWCAYTKHWFKIDDIVTFHIIDDMGEEIVLDLIEHNDALSIKRNKLYIVIHSEDENDNVVKDIIEMPTEETPLKEEQQKKDK